jgi:hypothetical protein
MLIPWKVYLWLLFSTGCILYDFFYIYLRPLSFRYNPYEWTFEPYQLYQFFDTLKINMQDRYLVIQSYFNLVEAALMLLTALIALLPFRKLKFACGIIMMVLMCFVFWKTVMYLLYDRNFITISTKRLYSVAVAFYYLTIGQWILFPLLTIYAIGGRLIDLVESKLNNKSHAKQ